MDKQQTGEFTYILSTMKTVLMLNNLIDSDKRNTILNSIYKGQILKVKKKKKEKNNNIIRAWVFFLYHITI